MGLKRKSDLDSRGVAPHGTRVHDNTTDTLTLGQPHRLTRLLALIERQCALVGKHLQMQVILKPSPDDVQMNDSDSESTETLPLSEEGVGDEDKPLLVAASGRTSGPAGRLLRLG